MSHTSTLPPSPACTASRPLSGLTAIGDEAPQIARGVLPNDVKAEIVVTANLREWHHLFSLRCAPNAHPHMRHVMRQGLAQTVEWFAPVFDDLAGLQ